MPQRSKSRLSIPKKRRRRHVSAPDEAPCEGVESDASAAAVPAAEAHVDDEQHGRRFAAARMEAYALMAWSNNYARLFRLEAEANGAHEAVGEYMITILEKTHV